MLNSDPHAAFLLGNARLKVSAKLFVAFYYGDMLGQACLAISVIRQNLYGYI